MSERMRIGFEWPLYWEDPSRFFPKPECDVPDGFGERWRAAEAEFDACQDIMAAAYKAANGDYGWVPADQGDGE